MSILSHAPAHSTPTTCNQCRDAQGLDFDFDYAYQPIVDCQSGDLFAHEALVRGPAGESAYSVLSKVNEENRYRFDQSCRVKAIKTASEIGLPTRLSINFMPNAIYRPELCIRTTLQAARDYNFPIERIIFETVEGERVDDGRWLSQVLQEYRKIGFLTAIDDFGAGFAGLNLLADFQPDIVKLDMGLIRNTHTSASRQSIVRAIARMGEELSLRVIAEGVETHDEYSCLHDLGISLMQGYFFGKPLFRAAASADELSLPAKA